MENLHYVTLFMGILSSRWCFCDSFKTNESGISAVPTRCHYYMPEPCVFSTLNTSDVLKPFGIVLDPKCSEVFPTGSSKHAIHPKFIKWHLCVSRSRNEHEHICLPTEAVLFPLILSLLGSVYDGVGQICRAGISQNRCR